ncbi:hypothetical protein [Pontibacillus sp. HMF3514]|uniref:hypothetical protein n=1 Tax=Pontibacillus sp. HMF3514 TaxID=2692425 RepID=UPI00131F8678|nr:hypothetical protein [Pontibacillus sp. HMF3514]QHE53678.1 hypothetical protein GS400_17375 [Pontibacillus sp. HMF3514]
MKKIKFLMIAIPIFAVIITTIVIWSDIVLTKKQKEEIHRVIQQEGGEVTDIQKVDKEETPFEIGNHENVYYQIAYTAEDGRKKTAWYRGTVVVNDIHDHSSRGHPEKWLIHDIPD